MSSPPPLLLRGRDPVRGRPVFVDVDGAIFVVVFLTSSNFFISIQMKRERVLKPLLLFAGVSFLLLWYHTKSIKSTQVPFFSARCGTTNWPLPARQQTRQNFASIRPTYLLLVPRAGVLVSRKFSCSKKFKNNKAIIPYTIPHTTP